MGILVARSEHVRRRDESPRALLVLRVAAGLFVSGCMAIAGAVVAGSLGWRASSVGYAASIGSVVAGLGWFVSLCVLVVALPNVVRRKRFWRNKGSLVASDCLAVEELARSSLSERVNIEIRNAAQ